MNKLGIGVLSLAVFMAACEDPAANKPKAQTTAPATNTATNSTGGTMSNTTATTMETKGTALPLTPENSKVEFVGSKVTGKHDGGFKMFTGTIDLVNAKPEESKVSFDIDANSIYSDDEKLTGHLKSADFFDVEKYPKATFVSTKIVPDAAKGAGNYTVTGDFDLHGQKKSIVFPAKITVDDAQVAVESEFSINRKDFGIIYAGKTDDLIRDDVVIKLNLKSPRKK
ncbi:MAG: YceI family protein [Pyrinomonadaceae bacterium]|nr:YceI family protein [Pyrinomonadaceae bacterium]